jgi:glucans biosynthesis protein C
MYSAIQASDLTQKTSNSTRYHGLDAARAIALLIGIFHHGIESFVTYVNSDWVTRDTQSSLVLDVLFYVSHVFRMQAFFLMSGFFAHLLYHRKGSREFISNRFKRLVLPFLLFWPFLYFADRLLWIWGIQKASHFSYDEAVAHLPAYFVWANGFPLLHLWFLDFLILFCAGIVIFRPAFVQQIDPSARIRKLIDRFLFRVLNKWWGSLVIGLLLLPGMLGMRDWFGVDTSSSGLIPRWTSFLIYGMYFTLGWFLHRQPQLIDQFRRFWKNNVVMALVFIFSLIILNLAYKAGMLKLNENFMLAIVNTVYTFASITAAMAFIGFMLSWFSRPGKTVRFLSDGAYWGYLIHMPIVCFMQDLVQPYSWHWTIKLLIIFAPTCLILWTTYKYWVRSSWMGQLLNGKRNMKNVF